jgi:uncharacterized protein (TIGR01777 family)
MKFVIPGGSGQIGTVLARALAIDGHEVVVLSRGGAAEGARWRTVAWDGEKRGDWTRELEGADVVVNLAGRSVNCRYGPENRALILQSRVTTTHLLGEAIAHAKRPPHTWLQASTATIYAHRYDAANDEATGILGGGEPDAPETWNFSIDVAKAWERTFDEAKTPATRKVALRAAMVMNPDRGSTFDLLLGLVRRGLGGKAGDGRQYMSWIHHDDFVNALLWLVGHADVSGPVNVAAPNPVPNAEFMKALREAWGIRLGLPAARWMIELGCLFMQTESELILKSRRVVPTRLLQGGFQFRHATWPEAARDLCAAWKRARL